MANLEEFAQEGDVLIGFRGQFVSNEKLVTFAHHIGYLCGEMIATMSIEQNRETLKKAEHGDKWLEMFDRWKHRHEEITKRLEAQP